MKKINSFRPFFLFLGILTVVSLELFYLEQFAGQRETQTGGEDACTYYMETVDGIFHDLKCFPVAKEEAEGGYPVTYENSWGMERTYGGERSHEGCDLMAKDNVRGKYQVLSMTDGTVQKIGWLEMGGWRIGILSDTGIYYYYAHLDSYEKAFEVGERVTAGQVLGRMGDSGYGKEPGTKGKFEVHLHVGIYIRDLTGRERAVNPYWYLKQLEI